MVTAQIEKAKSKNREELLNFERREQELDTRLNLILRYHPALSSQVHNIVKQHYALLNLNEEHRRVFKEVPRVTYRRAKNLKDGLVRASLPALEANNEAGSRGCGKKRCLNCVNVTTTKSFCNRDKSLRYDIRRGPHTCDTPNVVYLLECGTCGIQYVGSSKPAFRARINNYKSQHRRYLKLRDEGTLGLGKGMIQQALHAHFAQADHNGISDFVFTLIDSATDNVQARISESFWQYELDVFEPKGLNIRDVPLG